MGLYETLTVRSAPASGETNDTANNRMGNIIRQIFISITFLLSRISLRLYQK